MRIWMGGIIGNVIPMFGIILPSLFLGFTRFSHLILILLSVLPLVYLFMNKGKDKCKETVLNRGGDDVSGITRRVFMYVLLPVMLLTFWILTNHVLTPFENGGLAGDKVPSVTCKCILDSSQALRSNIHSHPCTRFALIRHLGIHSFPTASVQHFMFWEQT